MTEIVVAFVSGFLGIVIAWVNLRPQIVRLRNEQEQTAYQAAQGALTMMYAQLTTELQRRDKEIARLRDDYQRLSTAYDVLESERNDLKQMLETERRLRVALENDFDVLSKRVNSSLK